MRKRDRSTMIRFPCDSRLAIKSNFNNRELSISLRHNYHSSYTDIQPSSAVLQFIISRCQHQTPAEIFRDLKTSDVPDVEKIAQHQVYYQWQITNSSLWQHDIDPFISAVKHLDGLGGEYRHEIFTSGNLRALAIYIRSTVSTLVSKSQELVIDATYGTNNSGKHSKIRI